jgi:hypothetical protein
MVRTSVGDCMPALFPPGVPAAVHIGTEVELRPVGPSEYSTAADVRSRYQQVAARVRATSVRCEGCGERFEELEEYRVHECEVVYR